VPLRINPIKPGFICQGLRIHKFKGILKDDGAKHVRSVSHEMIHMRLEIRSFDPSWC
jgi:hypothetical protein